MQSRSYDLVFVFGSPMAQYVRSWPHLPRIVDFVDVDSDKWIQYSKRVRPPLSWLWKLEGSRLAKCESALVQAFSNTLVCTEAEGHLLRSTNPEGRIAVLQNSLDMDYFRPESVCLPEDLRRLQPYVIFTGTMDYFPNVDAVQFFTREVLPLIRSQVPNLNFVIAGRNPSPQVRRLGAEPAIHVTGTTPDIRPYLRGAAVAVAPMRIARGVQNKIFEAMAMDVPVVASVVAAGALPKEISSLLSAEADPELLAARVVAYLLESPKGTGALRAAVKRYIESLDLSSELERLLHDAVAAITQPENTQLEILV